MSPSRYDAHGIETEFGIDKWLAYAFNRRRTRRRYAQRGLPFNRIA